MSLKHGILGILTYGSRSGYDIKKIIDNSIGFMWSANLSQIYRDLAELEKSEFIFAKIKQQNDRPDKKNYTITEQGKAEFLKWIQNFPNKLSQPKRDDFMLRIFLGKHLKTDKIIRELSRFLEQQQTSLAGLSEFIHKFEQSDPKQIAEKDKIYWLLTAKRVIMTLKTDVQWAAESIEVLSGNKNL